MEALKNFGLTENEVKVYMSLLKRGSSKVSELSQDAKMIRTSVYDILIALLEKGIVSHRIVSGVKVYTAANPKVLIKIMKEREKKIEEILPGLEGLEKPSEKAFVEQFEGKRGILAILDDILRTRSDFLVYGNYEMSRKTLEHFPLSFRNKRLELKLKARIIIDATEEKFYKESKYQKFTEIKFCKDMKNMTSITFVYNNKIAIFTQKEDIIGIIINNKEINQTHRAIFETYWKISR